MTEHQHDFRRYTLADWWWMPALTSERPRNPTVQVFGPDKVTGGWYVGYECECGEQGYEVTSE